MELAKYKACICEGSAEAAIIDILLDNNLLIFERDEMLEEQVIRCREGKRFEERYLRKGFNGKISVIRILDSRRENFKLSRAYQDKVDVINTVYYIDGKAAEDFSEKFTYGWRYIKEYDPEDFKTDKNTMEEAEAAAEVKNKEIADYCASKWWEFYDFVTTSTDK